MPRTKGAMRLHFLGTSHGNHTYCRYNSSTLLQVGEADYLIDCGEPAAGTLVRSGLGFSRLQALFVTHLHSDHVGGLAALVNMLPKVGARDGEVGLYVPEEGLQGLEEYLHTLYLRPEQRRPRMCLRPVRPGAVYDDGRLQVRAVLSAHLAGSLDDIRLGPEPCGGQAFSYVMEAEGKRLAFSGDICGGLRGQAMDHLAGETLDLLVMEMTHIQPEDILPAVALMRPGQVVFYHIHDPWHGEGEAHLRGLCDRLLDCPYRVAHDGDTLEL